MQQGWLRGILLTIDNFKKLLYLGLVEFYQEFYGKFPDNEEAIMLLCKFYPKDVDLLEIQMALSVQFLNILPTQEHRVMLVLPIKVLN
ncbi:hypothetical protein [Desulfosporosinus sp.]|uniref:hypothetical protein n=1 Tax=Desulfosporosinus sp. TaxID=157907 RepID=UPI002320488A|nr:hypothetical protein [Desulfosporosinus sp.]MCO5388052.1 hypothetical protein [Desulfosporosinus sp.]MDA8222165.1 hypothetical protein [Desulfitobacterium hafniense]